MVVVACTQVAMMEVQRKAPDLGFYLIPVDVVAGHPEKPANTPKVSHASLASRGLGARMSSRHGVAAAHAIHDARAAHSSH